MMRNDVARVARAPRPCFRRYSGLLHGRGARATGVRAPVYAVSARAIVLAGAWLLLTSSIVQAQEIPAILREPTTAATTQASPTTVPSAAAKVRPTQAIAPANCTDAGCHAEVKNFKVVHGPVNVNACDACHKLTDAKTHKFTATREKADTCTFCHKMDLQGAAIVHKPLTTGDCLPCHNPHGGTTSKLLRSASMNDLCKQCHQDVIGKKKNVHGPVAAGACEACHSPHTAKFPKLLISEGKGLCLSCHKELSDQVRQTKFPHKPVAEGECAQCHDPHASDFAKQIKMAPADLCTSCHEHDKIKQQAMNATHKHSIVIAGQACLNCHTPHGGSLAKLVKTEPIKICMGCHNQKIEVDKTRSIAAVSEVIDPEQSKHGPIRDGNCSGCHNVHGGDEAKFLSKPYPAVFYQAFDVDKYALCFTCHDKQLVLLEKTKGLTGFRNGDRNLHYLHVNKADRGRSCRACHEVHASKQPLHLRESVPYGNWQLPINYKRTSTGGSCSPGCHKPFDYDRDNPRPTTAPSVAAPGANSEDHKS